MKVVLTISRKRCLAQMKISSRNIPRNIIIDGGIGDTYENRLKRKGDLFDIIEHIRRNEQKIDLLILTHFDDDHIGGLLRWLNKDKEAPTLIKKVWFNSGKEIAKELGISRSYVSRIETKAIGKLAKELKE